MRIHIFLFLMVFAIGCQSPEGPEVFSYGEEFDLKIGDKATIGPNDVTIEFVDVLGDSRCPTNVTCVWAGNGEVQIRFARKNLQLNTYLNPKDTTVSAVNIQLLRLEPYPVAPVQIEKEDYKVRLLITEQ